MCYNASSSITSYTYVSLLAIIVYLYGDNYDKHVALFFFVVIQIQMAEFFMHIDPNCGWVNKLATLGAFLILYAQPISAYYIGTTLKTIDTPDYFNYVYICYALYGIILWILYILRNKQICSTMTKGYLVWGFESNNRILDYINIILYLVLTSLPWLYLKNDYIKYLTLTIWWGSWLIHYILYPKHWKSMWCFFVSGMITIYAIVRYFALMN